MGQIVCNLLLQLSPQDFKEFGCFCYQSDIHFILIQKIRIPQSRSTFLEGRLSLLAPETRPAAPRPPPGGQSFPAEVGGDWRLDLALCCLLKLPPEAAEMKAKPVADTLSKSLLPTKAQGALGKWRMFLQLPGQGYALFSGALASIPS